MNGITTFTGKHFDPTQPDENKIDILDIAHALSMLCRGNGHVNRFFSVGQHCINCALEAKARQYPDRIVLACLLHDAGEAYMSDVPRPLKQNMPVYRKAEERLLDIIYQKFLTSSLCVEEERMVKEIDNAMLYYDLKELLNESSDREAPPLKITLNYQFVPFEEVERNYLDFFGIYKKGIDKHREKVV